MIMEYLTAPFKSKPFATDKHECENTLRSTEINQTVTICLLLTETG